MLLYVFVHNNILYPFMKSEIYLLETWSFELLSTNIKYVMPLMSWCVTQMNVHWEIQLFRPTNKSETSFWVGYTLINIKCSHWCTTHLDYSNNSTMMNFVKTHINTGSEEIVMLRSFPTDCQSQVWSIGQGACLIDATLRVLASWRTFAAF